MLEIFNNLAPFIEDCYLETGVREYARKQNISPPTASKMLEMYRKDGILKLHEERRHKLYSANRQNHLFLGLSRTYWHNKLIPVTDHLRRTLYGCTIVLYGSLNKAENTQDSDVDLAIFSPLRKSPDLSTQEKKLKRTIQVIQYPSIAAIKNENLKISIINGYVLTGVLK